MHATLQNLQTLAGSVLNDASFEKLRDKLNDFPKRLLSRVEEPGDYLFGAVTGEYDYHFTFRLEGGGFFQTGVVVASALSPSSGMPVPLKCRWLRKIDDQQAIEIPAVTSNMYQVSADDVGATIMVEAQPADKDDGWSGIARGEIGPFGLDPSTRRSLDNALGLGSCSFPAYSKSTSSSATATRQDFNISAAVEGVSVIPILAGVERADKKVFVSYTEVFPRIVIHTLDTSKFQLVLGEGRTFNFHAPSRTVRDLIALTIRCFHLRKFLQPAEVVKEILPIQPMAAETPVAGTASMSLGAGGGGGAAAGGPTGAGAAGGASTGLGSASLGGAASRESRLSTCIVLERLIRELNRAMVQKEVCEKVLRNTNHEKQQLQEQLTETISGFTEVVEGLQVQCSEGAKASCPSVTVERLQAQLQEIQAQNQTASSEVALLKKQVGELRASRKDAEQQGAGAGKGGGAATQQDVERLREERKLLHAHHLEVSSSSSASVKRQDQVEQSHALELKRLRQDVEELHDKKEVLRRQLQDADKERQDLQDNFLFVKGQLDKVQMRQAQVAASGMTDADEELQRLQESVRELMDEKSRLSARLELVCRDHEKEKAYHEQSLERVMTENSRVLEEKDRAEKEVRSVSQLYADAVKQLQQHSTQAGALRSESMLDTTQLGVLRSGSTDQEEIERLRAEILQAETSIKQKELENESLKKRIRKLAVA